MKHPTLKIIVASLTLLAGQAQASNINVGGVVWDPASPFDFITTDQMYETVVNVPGDVLAGFGRISSLNGNLATTFCPGCELTYQFGGYVLSPASTMTNFVFTGGWLKVYVDPSMNFDPMKYSTAGNGSLWLDLSAVTSYDASTGLTGTLHSDPTPTPTNVQGNGRGFLDVVLNPLALATKNFDTDTQTYFTNAMMATAKADFSFTSSFQFLPPAAVGCEDGVCYPLFGSNDLRGDSIPEPATLALVSLGLLGAGALRRRAKA